MLCIYSVLFTKVKSQITTQSTYPELLCSHNSLMTMHSANCWLNGGSGSDEERAAVEVSLSLKGCCPTFLQSTGNFLFKWNNHRAPPVSASDTQTPTHSQQEGEGNLPKKRREKKKEQHQHNITTSPHLKNVWVCKSWTDCQSWCFLNHPCKWNPGGRRGWCAGCYSACESETRRGWTRSRLGQDWTQGALGNIVIPVLLECNWPAQKSAPELSTFCAVPVLASFVLNWMCQLDEAADWKYFWTDSLNQCECCGYEWWCF